MTGTGDDRDGRQELSAVLLKIFGVAVAIGLVIGGGAWLLVKALGLDSSQTTGATAGQIQPITPLPTTALPVATDSPLPSSSITGLVTGTGSPGNGQLYLTATPVYVKPMERINLTGQWPGHDNVGLLVQRFENGSWSDFGVQTQVDVGTFATYVMTGRSGDQRFRVFDPQTKTSSNDVTVTVG